MKATHIHILLSGILCSAAVMAQNPPPGNHEMGAPPSFADMDKNGDGVLTSDELEGPMRNDFSQIDQDGDGSVTEAELEQHMRSHRPPEIN